MISRNNVSLRKAQVIMIEHKMDKNKVEYCFRHNQGLWSQRVSRAVEMQVIDTAVLRVIITVT